MRYDIKRVLSVGAMGALLTLSLAACGSASEEVEPTVTRIAVEGVPSGETASSPVAPAPTSPPDTGGQETAPAAEEPAPGGGQTAIDVNMVDLAFDPTELTIPGDTDVTLNLLNNGALPHNFSVVDGPESPTLDGGGTAEFVLNLAPGTYEYICSVPGHAEAGMRGTLTVQ